MSKPTNPAELEAMAKALDEVRKDWLRRPGVTALDVGFKVKDGKTTEDLAIRVHVRRKLPASELSSHDVFPKRLGPYQVDVIEADYEPQVDENYSA